MRSLLTILALCFLSAALADEKPKISPEDRAAILSAQLRSERALTALLSTPQYAALQAANAEAARVTAETGKRIGCQIDAATVECIK